MAYRVRVRSALLPRYVLMRTARIVFAGLYHVHCVKYKWSYFSGTVSVISAILQIFSMLSNCRIVLSWNRVDHEEDKQISDRGRCSAYPRANLSYVIANVRLSPLVFEKRCPNYNLSQLPRCRNSPALPYVFVSICRQADIHDHYLILFQTNNIISS